MKEKGSAVGPSIREASGSIYVWSKRSTLCGNALAWASIAVPDCTRMFYRAYCVASSATSTSWMRELAAVRFSLLTVN